MDDFYDEDKPMHFIGHIIVTIIFGIGFVVAIVLILIFMTSFGDNIRYMSRNINVAL